MQQKFRSADRRIVQSLRVGKPFTRHSVGLKIKGIPKFHLVYMVWNLEFSTPYYSPLLKIFLVISPKLGSSCKYVYICILKSCSSNLLYRTILSGSLCELSDHCYAAGFSVNGSNLNQQEKSIDRTYCVSCLSLTVPKI